jgi:2-C-methyl-D-erythritol 4-phosphate cytidylyltransferase
MRTENFGTEPAEALLEAETVAKATLLACFSPSTGEVIDIRLKK